MAAGDGPDVRQHTSAYVSSTQLGCFAFVSAAISYTVENGALTQPQQILNATQMGGYVSIRPHTSASLVPGLVAHIEGHSIVKRVPISF